MPDRKSERDERLAKALRENLKRRKAHSRELAERPDGEGNGDRNRDDHA